MLIKHALMSRRGDVLVDGRKLEKIREQKLLTQEEFASLIGVNRSWVNATEKEGTRRVLRSIVVEIAKRLGVEPRQLVVDSDSAGEPSHQGFERVQATKRPFFDVTIPAGGWIESGEPRSASDADGWELVEAGIPEDAFLLRIFGPCMEPDYPSGSVIVFVPVRDGERGARQFENGKDYYFEHSDGKATFKRVYYEKEKERYKLVPLNSDFKTIYVPEQMKARLSRAVMIMRRIA